MKKIYIDVVFGLPIKGPFTYEAPLGLADGVSVGKRVWAPFGNRRLVGYIVGLSDTPKIKKIKCIYSIIDDEPILRDDILKTAKWISEYYFCSWGEAIEAAIPTALKKGRIDIKIRHKADEEDIKPSSHLAPTPEQNKALRALWQDIDSDKHDVYLLYGITASGKTEVYLQAISRALEKNKSSIVLVPEISLTPQTIERFKSRFKDEVAVLHSRLTEAARFSEWKKIYDQKAHIVVGARSAIFAPVKNLGLIVVDEEHETSYKQQDSPRYHAREVAIKRASFNNAVVILGSATPSLESYHNAKNGIYKLLSLRQRVLDQQLPAVNIIDMRRHAKTSKAHAIFSRPLEEAVRRVLENNEQAILFLNRRGFATFMNCRKCGYVLKCKNCDVTLTYHFQDKELVCHWCNYRQKPPQVCPQCEGSYINYFGIGTEKVESEINRLFANVSTSRMDTDATVKRNSHKDILDDFRSGQTHLLVGTQMIAKGLDFPRVTLVGVISADIALHVPDFRCGERTFNLLTQVAGRAGRGEAQGRVLVQTFTPQHYAIVAASRHDYDAFFDQEIKYRRQLNLPPYAHLVIVTFISTKQYLAQKAAEVLSRLLKAKGLDISGPALAPSPRLRKKYRWNVILKAKSALDAVNLLKRVLPDFKKPSAVRMAVDVDPL
jgi:primosomal protein N' (replication factor Y)